MVGFKTTKTITHHFFCELLRYININRMSKNRNSTSLIYNFNSFMWRYCFSLNINLRIVIYVFGISFNNALNSACICNCPCNMWTTNTAFWSNKFFNIIKFYFNIFFLPQQIYHLMSLLNSGILLNF